MLVISLGQHPFKSGHSRPLSEKVEDARPPHSYMIDIPRRCRPAVRVMLAIISISTLTVNIESCPLFFSLVRFNLIPCISPTALRC